MRTQAVLIITLIVYQAVLLAIGWWVSRRNRNADDFYLGGRRLGPWLAALSASSSSSSAWSLLGVSGAAFAWGLPAIWLLPATLLGFVINWYWVAPRLHRASHANQALTLTQFIADSAPAGEHRRLLQLGTLIILFSFTFYIASQLQAAGATFAEVLPISMEQAILLGATVVMIYVLLGGFWAASITDAVQGVLMFSAAVILPWVALSQADPAAVVSALYYQSMQPGGWSLQVGVLASVLFVVGLFGIGLGYPGQPHVVNRFMAMQHAADIPRGRRIALLWAACIYTGMIILGWSARVLFGNFSGDSEGVLFYTANQLLPPIVAGIMVSAILSAIMSTTDSQLLVTSSAVSHDWPAQHGKQKHALYRARLAVAGVSLAAVLLALFSPQSIFQRVLFAWQALAAAFGPILIILLWRGSIQPGYRLAAMLSGFCLTLIIHWLPATPGGVAERYIPLILAFSIAYLGSIRRN